MIEYVSASDFWDRIKKEVRRKNITLESIASCMNVSAGTVRQQIFHNRFPDVYQGYMISQELDISLESLITGIDPAMKEYDETIRAAAQMMRELSESDKKTAFDIIKMMYNKELEHRKKNSAAG